MLTLSNVLSLSRAGFALCFLQANPFLRVFAIFSAMVTDYLDGFFARRTGTVSHFGAILDPIMDKFFVFFAGGVLYLEGRIASWEFCALVSRDIALCCFGLYLALVKGWKEYECRAILVGKFITTAQFFVLIFLSCGGALPSLFFLAFIGLALLSFLELLLRHRRSA